MTLTLHMHRDINILGVCAWIWSFIISVDEWVVSRAGNEPSYSGSARKKLGSGSTLELNEPSLSLNLGLINLRLGSGSVEKISARATGTHPSLERGFRLRSPADRIWSSPVRSRLRHAEVKCPGHVSRISM